MSVVEDLIAAIEADPKDEASQLVIGDFLQAAGDPRGDLIVLDHAEKRGMLDDPEALEQLLLLGAAYSFPHAEPPEPMFPFVLRGTAPLSYELRQGKKHHYVLTYRRSGFHFERRGKFSCSVPVELVPERTDEQVDVVLTILSDVIRANTPFSDELRFPYGTMPLPQYEGSPLRCYQLPLEFTIPREILRNQHGLVARDYHRWHAIWDRLRVMQRR